MDIEDKLKLLKKERDVRSRSRAANVEATWAKIEKNGNMSVKEKLEKLISLTGAKKEKPREKSVIEPRAREPLVFMENSYPLQTTYGKQRLSDGLAIRGEILYKLSRDRVFEDLDLSTALFIDLETTGLAGGTGTLPFLIGTGYFRDDKFHIAQFFLGEPAEEERLIRDFAGFLKEMDFQSVVTYNGKAFDLPLLETRFILNRQPFILADLPHLDFLFSARSLWKHKHESCRLFHLAQQIVEAERAEDIPSSEVPYIYSMYLRSGDFSFIEPILYHNQEDILSLLGLVIAGAKLFIDDRKFTEGAEFDAMDMIGIGKIYRSVKDVERWVESYRRALTGDLPEEWAKRIKTDLSFHFKKNENWEEALGHWKDLASMGDLRGFEELAMYYEHKAKDYHQAKRWTEEGLALSMDVSFGRRKDFKHRLERLNAKIRRQSESRKAEKSGARKR